MCKMLGAEIFPFCRALICEEYFKQLTDPSTQIAQHRNAKCSKVNWAPPIPVKFGKTGNILQLLTRGILFDKNSRDNGT